MPDAPNVPDAAPVDEVAALAASVGAGAAGWAAIEPDTILAGVAGTAAGVVAGAGVCVAEPDVEPDVPAVDGVVTGVKVVAGAVAGVLTGADVCVIEPGTPVVDGCAADATADATAAGVDSRANEPYVEPATPAGAARGADVTVDADAAGCESEADAVPVT